MYETPIDSLKKVKELGCVPQNKLLVTGDVVGLYPSIPHLDGLEVLSIKVELASSQKDSYIEST